ncbi:MAG: DUF3489 domain-containing protein [Planktomarina sp.]
MTEIAKPNPNTPATRAAKGASPAWAKPTKKAQLIELLGRKNGVDVPTLCKKFGWQPHSTRAALTGLRNAGYDLVSTKPENGKAMRYSLKPASDTGVAQ